MMDDANEILTQLPVRLKEARRAQGLSLDAVSKLSGVSRSMVSQIERGESSPTIATLWNLTRALQVDFAGLLDGAPLPTGVEHVAADAVPTIQSQGQGCQIRILSPPQDSGRYEVYELNFVAGGVLDSQPHGRGAREHLTVLEGQVVVTSAHDTALLKTGDVGRYAADVNHRITAGADPARAVLVVVDAG